MQDVSSAIIGGKWWDVLGIGLGRRVVWPGCQMMYSNQVWLNTRPSQAECTAQSDKTPSQLAILHHGFPHAIHEDFGSSAPFLDIVRDFMLMPAMERYERQQEKKDKYI